MPAYKLRWQASNWIPLELQASATISRQQRHICYPTTMWQRSAPVVTSVTLARSPNSLEKEGIGHTGVHLQYHKPEEYTTLSKEQTDELRAWRTTPAEGKQKSKRGKGKDKGQKKGQ
jgi:hypothetical protein